MLLTLLYVFPLQAVEDPVVTTINDAVKKYNQKQYTVAVSHLEYASQLIRQRRGEQLSRLLPEPITGWTAKKSEYQAIGASMFSKGTTAIRLYSKESVSLSIKIISDSPMMQTMLMIYNNPAFAGSIGEVEVINGQKAMVNISDDSSTVNIVINNSMLVTLEGKNISQNDLMEYVKAIDYTQLKALP